MESDRRPPTVIPFRKRRVERECRRARALLVLHMLGDEEGLLVQASRATIARELGRTAENTKAIFRELWRSGDIAIFSPPQYPVPVTTIVFMDHPRAMERVAELEASKRWETSCGLPPYCPW